MSRTPRLAAAVAAAGLAVAAVPLAAVPAQAAPCSGSTGVTVVVDFGPLGGIRTSCAAGDPSSGIAALQSAGFSVTGTQQYGLAFVCRVSGLPTPAQDPCVRTPPTTAYWAYFHASRGGSWSYSTRGATSHDPAPGSVEGWRFGSGAAPGIAPPSAPAPPPPPKPKPTTKPPTRPAPPPPGVTTRPPAPGNPGSSVDPGDPPRRTNDPGAETTRPGGTTRPPGTGPATTAPGATMSAAPGATTDPASPGTTTEPPVVATEPTGSSRGLTGSLVGAALVAAVALAAFQVIRRRRGPA